MNAYNKSLLNLNYPNNKLSSDLINNLSTNTLEKGMNPIILPPAMGK